MVVTYIPYIYPVLSPPGHVRGTGQSYKTSSKKHSMLPEVLTDSIGLKLQLPMQSSPAFSSPTKVTEEASVEILEQKDQSHLVNELLDGGTLPWRVTWIHNRVCLLIFVTTAYITQPVLTSIITEIIVRDFCVSTYDTTTEL